MKAFLFISAMIICLIGSIDYANAAPNQDVPTRYKEFCKAYGCVRPSLDSMPICNGKKIRAQ